MAIEHPDMMQITVAQAIALHKVYNRTPVYKSEAHCAAKITMNFDEWVRDRVSPGSDCIMVEWQGMFLGVEADGYVHS